MLKYKPLHWRKKLQYCLRNNNLYPFTSSVHKNWTFWNGADTKNTSSSLFVLSFVLIQYKSNIELYTRSPLIEKRVVQFMRKAVSIGQKKGQTWQELSLNTI